MPACYLRATVKVGGDVSIGYLSACVYPQALPVGLATERLPGLKLERLINSQLADAQQMARLESKLAQSCRKICMMCVASERAIHAEKEFYATTIKDAPALFGEHAIEIAYHLESFIFFARSSLDIAATIFGSFLFDGKRYDSFNDLSKDLVKRASEGVEVAENVGGSSIVEILARHILAHQKDDYSWLSTLCGSERGRALRDKIAHQTGFPIDYEELHLGSEKENAVVSLSAAFSMPLEDFVNSVRDGVVQNYLIFEDGIMGT
jgi:hypothetical protein